LDVTLFETGLFKNQSIAPMILQPFVENAFKHGVSKNLDNQWLEIHIIFSKNMLDFRIRNPKGDNAFVEEPGVSEGIGLENVRKRLSIIYPDRHTLEIVQENGTFMVDLKLILDHDVKT
jgi:LytS/YehU family sensor histidine kinase